MKNRNVLLTASLLYLATVTCQAQSIVGKWQLMKQTSCLEDEISVDEMGMEEVLTDMKSMSGSTPQTMTLKNNNSGEESTKIINRRKSYNSKSFLYKHSGDALHFLDKKSRTIIESFTIEKLAGDSLIISNAARVCETKVFIRIK